MKRVLLIMILTILFGSSAMAETCFVQKVIDARTLKLLNGETVRLIGVEDPEGKTPDAALAAKDFVRGLVSGTIVELEYDVEKRDNDGYLLAYVWFIYPDGASNDFTKFPEDYKVHFAVNDTDYQAYFVFLNATIIKAGHGIPAKEQSNALNMKHAKLFKELYEERALQSARADLYEPLSYNTLK